MLTKRDIIDHMVAYKMRPPRTLKCTWSAEAAKDLAAFHNVDAEKELVAAMSKAIGVSLDAEILNDLISKK